MLAEKTIYMHKILLLTLLATTTCCSFAQTTYIPLAQEEYNILDKLETRTGALSNNLYTGIKPISRKSAVNFLLTQTDTSRSYLSKIDRFNIAHLISKSGEWVPDENGAIDSKKPILKSFYKKQTDMVWVKTDNFFLSLNPVINQQLIYEKDNPSHNLITSQRGIEVRGWISKKIGFYTFLTDNQERTPLYIDKWIAQRQAVPGADYYTTTNTTHYDYFLARGYIDFAIIKNHINATFGYDKQFIGDGIRSMILSDFSAASPFLRINTNIWKLHYQNLFMELTRQFDRNYDGNYPHKYAAIHSLNINLTRWLNLGVFESVIFDRSGGLEIRYLNPLIFYRSVERSLGSPDNMNLGFSFKAIAARHLQLYSQFYLDEFKAKEFFSHNGWWGNKWSLQMGGKYFDAFTVKNLDLQGEINVIRPYTYSHDTIANYTHYNQPLAHPLGSGFIEVIGMMHYQPAKRLFLSAKGMYYTQGVDTGKANFGNNIFKDYATRRNENGVGIINGPKAKCALINLNASYEIRDNIFFDLGFTYRKYVYETLSIPATTSTYITTALRINIARRDYTFF